MYFYHLIVGRVELRFNRGVGTGKIAVRIGNSSSEDVPVDCRAEGDIRGNLCKINPAPPVWCSYPDLFVHHHIASSRLYDHDTAGKIPQFVDAVSKRLSPCCVLFCFDWFPSELYLEVRSLCAFNP
jgi:hypothetical protein